MTLKSDPTPSGTSWNADSDAPVPAAVAATRHNNDAHASVASDDAAYNAARRRVLTIAGGAGAALLLTRLARPAHADALFDLKNERTALRVADELIEMCADYFSRVTRTIEARADGRQSSVLNLVATQDRAQQDYLRLALKQLHALDGGAFFTPNAQALPGARTFAFPPDALTSQAKALSFGITLKDTTVGALHGVIPFFESRDLLEAAAGIAGVQGRHAAALREVAGADPFPQAFEPALSLQQVSAKLAPYGFKGGAVRS